MFINDIWLLNMTKNVKMCIKWLKIDFMFEKQIDIVLMKLWLFMVVQHG